MKETNFLAEQHRQAVEQLGKAHDAVQKLARQRIENKLSNNRAVGVARELGDLLKVMKTY